MALPREIKTEMATTEMKARIRAYSTNVCPFLCLRYATEFFFMIPSIFCYK